MAVGNSTFDVICNNGWVSQQQQQQQQKVFVNYEVRWANFSGPVRGTMTVSYGGRGFMYFIASFHDAVIYSGYTMLMAVGWNMGNEYWCNDI